MKNILFILSFFVCSITFGQTLTGGNALLDGDTGELPVSYYKNCMSANLTETDDRTHNANKHFYVINRLNYWQANAGVISPMSLGVDSTSVSASGSGQFTVDCEDGIYMRGNTGFWPAIKAHGTLIDLKNPSGVTTIGDVDSDGNDTYIKIDDANQHITIANIPSFADNAAAITGGLTSGMLYRNGDQLMIVH